MDTGMWVVIAGLSIMVVSLKFEVRRLNRRIDRVGNILIKTPIN
jgi:hypothetical protein